VRRLFACAVAVVAGVTVVRTQSAVEVLIDTAAERRPIDARIYGVAHADPAAVSDLRIPLHRWGGNVSTRHNWQANASNRGSDWYFESLPDGPATAGDSADSFVSQSKTNGAEPIITIPMAGWVARVGADRSRLASFSIAKYGAQTGSDAQWFSDAGNGIRATTGQPITGNDPNDANTPSDATFQRGWVQHLVTRWGPSSGAGVRYYALDNEPSIWHSTHRDVHPSGASMDEVFNRSVSHGTQIKAVDGGAQVMGPEEWGWTGYFYSGRDQQWAGTNGWSNPPDRAAHGNADYLPWFLAQMRQRDAAAGQRLLDIFTVHYYPQAGQFSNDTSTSMQQLRNRSTRALWDPNYVDESWIGTQVQLIPRLKNWVTANYPGTKVGVTEYNWGAEGHINGATTQADILGIFGREALDVATFWTCPAASTPTYKAIKLYRNYDGQGSGFGTTSVRATAPNPDLLSVFAAQRPDNTLTIMAINKDLATSPAVNFRLSNFTGLGAVQVWRLSSTNTIGRLADTAVSSGTVSATLPVQSITLFVVPGQAGASTPSAPTNLHIVFGAAGSPASITASTGTPQSAPVNGVFGTALRATVRDVGSNPLSGVAVTFSLPASGASARFGASTTATVLTDASGVATAPPLTANGTPGSFTATASVAGVGTPASFSLTNTSGTPPSPGGAWTNVTPAGFILDPNYPRPGDNYGVMPVLVDPARPSDFYAFTNYQGVFKSTDYGLTWAKVSTGSNSDAINGGRNWAATIDPNKSRNPATPPTLYTQAGYSTVGKMGIWKSTDGGVNWTSVWNTVLASNGSTNITSQVWIDMQGLSVDPNNGDHLLTANHGNTVNGAYDNHIFETTNGGQTWIHRGNPCGGVHCTLAFITSTTWIAIAEGWGPGAPGSFVTTNSGASWTRVGQYGKAHGNEQVTYLDANGTLYLAAMEGIYKANSPYLSFTQVDTGAAQSVIGTPNYLYASYGWASLGGVPPALRRAPASTGTPWDSNYTATPSGMTNGAMGAAVSYNQSTGKYVIVTGNWAAGIWRYVE